MQPLSHPRAFRKSYHHVVVDVYLLLAMVCYVLLEHLGLEYQALSLHLFTLKLMPLLVCEGYKMGYWSFPCCS
jgi:hypothetical protein